MKRIDEDIKLRQFKNLYLIYGDEEYLKLQYKKKLISALVSPDDNMNFTKYEGNNVSIPQVIDQAETMPFFAEYRVILLDECGFGKGSCEELSEYIKNIPAATVFIIVESAIDKRGKFYKSCKEHGLDVEMSMPNEDMLQRWIASKLKSNNKKMNQAAWVEFFNRTNESMENMDRELEKLLMYVGDREQIQIEDVKSICIAQVESKIFDMLDAIASKNLPRTMDLYSDMIAAKEPPMRILYMIVRQFRQLNVVKDLASHGYSDATIAQKIGSRDFIVKKLRRLANNFSTKSIRTLLQDAAAFEQQVKSGLMDEAMALELLIIKYTK